MLEYNNHCLKEKRFLSGMRFETQFNPSGRLQPFMAATAIDKYTWPSQ